MSDTTWKVGDVVRLKSGGPTMTVGFPPDRAQDLEGYFSGVAGGVFAQWFCGKDPEEQYLCSGFFHKDSLAPVASEKDPE